MRIEKVIENKQSIKEIHSITCPHWGKPSRPKTTTNELLWTVSISGYLSVKKLTKTVVKALVINLKT
jgi:hypothetical protein